MGAMSVYRIGQVRGASMALLVGLLACAWLSGCSGEDGAGAETSKDDDIIDELISEAEKRIEPEKEVRIELPDRKKLEEKRKKDIENGECDDPRDCFIEGRRALLDGGREQGLLLLDKACDLEVIASCRQLAKIYKTGDLIIKEDDAENLALAEKYAERALEITRKGCENGEAPRCTELGKLHTTGDGVAQDRFIAKAFFNRACELGGLEGCRQLGNIWNDRNAPFRDPSKAVDALLRVCDLEEPDAKRCSDLGRMLSERVIGQRAIAFPLLEKSCEDGKPFACMTVAEFYQAGLGVEKDQQKADRLRASACNENSRGACYSLGLMYQTGALVPQDAVEALRLFQIACSAGEREACKKARDFLKTAGDPEEKERREKLEVACKEKGGPACHTLGKDLLPGGGRTPDQRLAFTLFEQTCREGYVPSCVQVAEMHELGQGVLRDIPSALAAYQDACKRGSGEGCHVLSRYHRLGTHIERDEDRAVQFSAKACDLGLINACTEAGIAYMFGNGVERDFSRAKDLLDKACDGGHARGCSQLEIARDYAPK